MSSCSCSAARNQRRSFVVSIRSAISCCPIGKSSSLTMPELFSLRPARRRGSDRLAARKSRPAHHKEMNWVRLYTLLRQGLQGRTTGNSWITSLPSRCHEPDRVNDPLDPEATIRSPPQLAIEAPGTARRTLRISCEAAIWTGLVSCIRLFDGSSLKSPP